MINKNDFKKVSLHNMGWEIQSLQEIIKEKKNEAEENLLKDSTEDFIKYINQSKEALTEREINSFLKLVIEKTKQIEKEV